MKCFQLIIVCLFLFSLSSCAQENRYVAAFKDTKAYPLAKAVEREDLDEIERLVRQDSALMEFANPVNGSNVLVLSIDTEKYESFKKLLELGANPNFINPYTRHSVLIDAIQPFGSQFEWRKDNRYVELLLEYGADPNYAVENDFTNEKGYHIRATSPLMEASSLNLEAVKLLVKHGADPNKRLEENQSTGLSRAVRRGNIDIINYYLDSLKVDVHQPMSTVIRKPDNEKITYFIQDYIVNKFTKAKLMGDTAEMERLKQQNEDIEEANEELWQLIQKLEKMGVDFKNYDYKL
jgi:ankyrin repeat protein